MAGVPYTEQNHLHGQRREFYIWNNAQKTKETAVKTILFSLAYLTPIKLTFLNEYRHRPALWIVLQALFFIKKKLSVRNHFTVK